MNITILGGLIFFYEVFAMATGRSTWTKYAALRDLRVLPCAGFAAWLVVHLVRAGITRHD